MHNSQGDYGQTVQDLHLPAVDLVIKIRFTNGLLAPRFCRMFRVWVPGSGAKTLLFRTATTEAWQEVYCLLQTKSISCMCVCRLPVPPRGL